jgi:3-hydroxyacyl-[acyl-carrier-protein] dehydratase
VKDQNRMSESLYHYNFTDPIDYLHHRPPYLMVDRIIAIEDQRIVTESTVSADSFYGQGHFPGSPVLPGALMQEMTTQSAGILIAARFNPMSQFNTHDPLFNEYALGVLVKVDSARYKGFARPGNLLQILVQLENRLGNAFDFSGTVKLGDTTILRNRFRLANIPSAVLQGGQTAQP